MSTELGPVGILLSNPDNWEKERDCSTDQNRLTKPTSDLCVRWSVRAAAELKYENQWRSKMDEFMIVARKYYPTHSYKTLHQALSHDALMFLLVESKL